jgi:citrate synthase
VPLWPLQPGLPVPAAVGADCRSIPRQLAQVSLSMSRESPKVAAVFTSPVPAMPDPAILQLGDQRIELPVVVGTEREHAIDIRQLRAKTGCITFDPGYGNTGSCRSAITFIDGEQGILRYRGIPIEQFAETPNFVEVAYLLIFGNLPSAAQYAAFARLLTETAHLHEGLKHHFEGFPRSAPPMAILSAMINALSCFHPEILELEDEGHLMEAAARLISKVRTIAAYAYRHSKGLPHIYPDPNLRYVGNFLHMMFSMPYEQYIGDEVVRHALNLVLILHADHEQNCSTSTVRMVGSSQANLFASCAAGVCALWGPRHGGANVEVLKMLERIHQGKITPEEYVRLAKDKSSNVRLMGFGHRVYKNFDPRARILAKVADNLLNHLGLTDPLLEIARRLEQIALEDPYFVERKLYPNVDFYSGIILRAIGIPTNMFTVMFAIGRLPGWIAHWWEQIGDPDDRIARPRQIYTGNAETCYVSEVKRR